MQLKQLIKIASKSLVVNRSRSFLTALGVIIGVASVILLVSVGSGLKDFITGQMQDMGSNLIMVVPGDINIEQAGAAGGGAASGALSSITASKLELSDVEEIKRSLPQLKDTAARRGRRTRRAARGRRRWRRSTAGGRTWPETATAG